MGFTVSKSLSCQSVNLYKNLIPVKHEDEIIVISLAIFYKLSTIIAWYTYFKSVSECRTAGVVIFNNPSSSMNSSTPSSIFQLLIKNTLNCAIVSGCSRNSQEKNNMRF